MNSFWIVTVAASVGSPIGPGAAQSGPPEPRWTEVSAGDVEMCALDAEGRAACWGPSVPAGIWIAGGLRLASIAVGIGLPCEPQRNRCTEQTSNHVCALSVDARAWCWGDNRFGQLGDGTTTDRPDPVAVDTSMRFRSIRAGRGFTCGIANAAAWCWGFNGLGNLGIGDTTADAHPRPRLVSRRALAVEAAAGFACALSNDGLAWCWGADYHGRLGSDAAAATGATPAPVPVNGVSRFTALSARGNYVCGLTRSGNAWCWGSNVDGQLGSDPADVRARRDPGDSGAPLLAHITTSITGHTCGIAPDYRAWCWGRNASGELGTVDPAMTICFAHPCAPRPSPVGGGQRFRSLSAGSSFTCGVTDAGQLVCWGRLPWSATVSTSPIRMTAPVPPRAGHDAPGPHGQRSDDAAFKRTTAANVAVDSHLRVIGDVLADPHQVRFDL